MLNELDLDHEASELPIACKLSGDELAERGEEVDDLFKEVEQVRELADLLIAAFSERMCYVASTEKCPTHLCSQF